MTEEFATGKGETFSRSVIFDCRVFFEVMVQGVVAKGVEDKKNSLHMIDTFMENMEDRLPTRENKGEYAPTESEGRADELSIEDKRYLFISAYLNRRPHSEGAEKSSPKADKVRNISSDDLSEKYSLTQGGKREDHQRNNSKEEDFEGNEDKDGEYSDNEGREEGKARKYPSDDEREKNPCNNKSQVEDHTRSWWEDHHRRNRGEEKEYSDYEGREREDWEKYFQTNTDKEEDSPDEEDRKEGFHTTGDQSVSDPTSENEEKGNHLRKTAEEIAKWAENMIQNAAGKHLVEKRSSEDCESGGDPCGAIPGNGTLDSSVRFRDHSSTLWPFGSNTGYPLVPYRILVKDPALVAYSKTRSRSGILQPVLTSSKSPQKTRRPWERGNI
ncbi:rho GTPase-activating protein 30-like isoform X2 [Macrobrachium nipponense]|uniref:rho GTPase-activating protein 30-like isoform X2 n=1 Tax=Macrobrachium nipponense TaxID=159736 RepID=UPI0030C899D9